MAKWWISNPNFTGQVDTDSSGVLTATPPVWKKFKGQPLSNLEKWLKSLGGFERVMLSGIVAVTGHRPDRLGPGGYKEETLFELAQLASSELQALKTVDWVFTGMAQGWDTAVALACVDLGIEYTAAVPFPGQERMWPPVSQGLYRSLLDSAAKVEYVSTWEEAKDAIGPAMHKRNRWMVDRCDAVLALFGGAPGGTAGCVEYAKKVGKPVVNCWAKWDPWHKKEMSWV